MSRFLPIIAFLLLLHPVFAQDTCSCNELRYTGGSYGQSGQLSRNTSSRTFTGICFEAQVSRDTANSAWRRYENGYLVESHSNVYNGKAHYIYKEVRRDTLISYTEQYNISTHRLQQRSYVYEKNGKRYRLEYSYAYDSGRLTEIRQQRYKKKDEAGVPSYYTNYFDKDGYYNYPVMDGIYVYYGNYSSGKPGNTPTRIGHYKDGIQHGYWEERNYDGSLVYTGWYKMGAVDSLWTRYYPGGKKNSEGNYKNGMQDGEWKNWDNQGQLLNVAHYRGNMLNGNYTEYYPNGHVKKSEEYRNGMRNGKSIQFNASGLPEREGYYSDDQANGRFHTWYPGGQEQSFTLYRNGMPDSICREWHADGKPAEYRRYKMGKMTDTSLSWYGNGNLKARIVYENPDVAGSIETWYELGYREKEEHYHNAQPDGFMRKWNRKGILILEAEYQSGKRNGIYRTWTEDGNPLLDYRYSMQVRNGKCRRWDGKGNLLFEREYKMGKVSGITAPAKVTPVAECKPDPANPYTACAQTRNRIRPDVLLLATRVLKDTNSPYHDSVIIPQRLIDRIELALVALSNSEYTTSLIKDYNSGTIDQFTTVTIEIRNQKAPGLEWISAWKAGKTMTGNAAVDKLLKQYALKLQPGSIFTVGDNVSFVFESAYALNVEALSRELRKIDRNLWADKEYGRAGDGNHLYLETQPDYSVLTIDYGRGDCRSGCASHDRFTFYIYADGELDLISNTQTK